MNLHKLTQQWRAVLRQTRAAELRSDIAVLSQTFERVLDRKDSVIKVRYLFISTSICERLLLGVCKRLRRLLRGGRLIIMAGMEWFQTHGNHVLDVFETIP